MIKKILKLIIGLLLLSLLFYKIGIKDITTTLSKTNPLILILISIPFILSFVISILKLQTLLKPIAKIEFKTLFKPYIKSWAIGKFSPGKIGEFSISYFLKDKITVGEGMSISLIDKVSMFITSALIASFGFLIFFGIKEMLYAITFATILFIGFIIMMSSELIRGIIKKYILRKHQTLFKGFSKYFFKLLKHKEAIFMSSIYSIIKVFTFSGIVYFSYWALGYQINIFTITIIMSIENLIALIPISFDGLGIKQGTGVYLYNLIGISPIITAGRYVITLGINYIVALIIYFKEI